MRSLLVVLAACCCGQQALAFNKCVNHEGDTITYTDARCPAESQPVNARENTVRQLEADKQRIRNEQVQSQRRATEVQREHASQYNHAVQVRSLAEAEERSRAARNAEVAPIVPRSATHQNPTVTGPNWYPR